MKKLNCFFVFLLSLVCACNQKKETELSTPPLPARETPSNRTESTILDQQVPEQVGWRQVIGEIQEDKETGISSVTFSLTWRENEIHSLRTAFFSSAALKEERLDILKPSTGELLVRLVRRSMPKHDGTTNTIPLYYVTAREPLAVATPTSPLVVTPETTERDTAPAAIPAPDAIIEETPADTEPLPAPATQPRRVETPTRSATNTASLPVITVQKTAYSTTLTDYLVQYGTWWGVHQDKRGTKIYADPRKVGRLIIIEQLHPRMLQVFARDRTSNEPRSITLFLKDKVRTGRYTVLPADEDSIKFGVAFLQERMKTERIRAPMAEVAHPHLFALKIPPSTKATTSLLKKTPSKPTLSPRAQSHVSVRMKRNSA